VAAVTSELSLTPLRIIIVSDATNQEANVFMSHEIR
jgi:hypothetical protein